jgi:hypothetical protein
MRETDCRPIKEWEIGFASLPEESEKYLSRE